MEKTPPPEPAPVPVPEVETTVNRHVNKRTFRGQSDHGFVCGEVSEPITDVPIIVEGREVGRLTVTFADPLRAPTIQQQGPRRPALVGTMLPGAGEIKTTIGQKFRGAVGLAKAEFQIGRATPDQIEARKGECLRCEHYDFGRCTFKTCGCYLYAKIRITGERCPINKW